MPKNNSYYHKPIIMIITYRNIILWLCKFCVWVRFGGCCSVCTSVMHKARWIREKTVIFFSFWFFVSLFSLLFFACAFYGEFTKWLRWRQTFFILPCMPLAFVSYCDFYYFYLLYACQLHLFRHFALKPFNNYLMNAPHYFLQTSNNCLKDFQSLIQ